MGGGILGASGRGDCIRVCGSGLCNGNGPDRGCGGRGSGSWRWSGIGSDSCGSSGCGRGSHMCSGRGGVPEVVVAGGVECEWTG